MSRHTDGLIDRTLELVRGALRRDQIDFKEETGTVETNLFASDPSGVAVGSKEMVTSGPAQSRISAERPNPDALPPEQHKGNQDDFLSVAERDTGSPNETSNQQNWLDTERANMRRRVSAFKEIQGRFQREREEYYTATITAVRANEWKPKVSHADG